MITNVLPLSLTVAGMIALTSVSHANTITVCANDCQYTSINAAIDAANHGDVILLSALPS